MSDKKQRVRKVFKGRLVWADVFAPSKKYNKFSAKIKISEEDYKALKAEYTKQAKEALEEYLKENPKERKKSAEWKLTTPVGELEDKEGEPTGEFYFKSKRDPEWYENKGKANQVVHTVRIPVVDAKKNELKSRVRLGSDSLVAIAVSISTYVSSGLEKYGVSASLEAVQIIELKEFGGGGVDQFGDEDGFEASDDSSEAEEPKAPAAKSSSGGEDGDF